VASPSDATQSFYAGIPRHPFEASIARKRAEAAGRGATGLLVEELRHAFPSGRIPGVLEVGGEYAATLAVLRETFQIDRAVSTDLVIPTHRVEGIEYLALPAESLTGRFAPGSFDLVMLNDVIEHVYDTDRVLEEVRTVIRPGGFVAVVTPNLSSWLNRLLLAVGLLPLDMEVSTRAIFGHPSAPGTQPVGHIRVFTLRALQEFLRFHGFEVVATRTAPIGLSDSTITPAVTPVAPGVPGLRPPVWEPGSRARLLGAIVAIDRLVSRLAPSFGSRIVVLARAPPVAHPTPPGGISPSRPAPT
jgi:SAM-dependent methyltransferase